MRLGEVPFAPDVEQVLDSVEVEKERVAAAAGEESIGARPDDIRLGVEGYFGVGDDLGPYRFVRARLRARRHEYVNGLPAVLRLGEHIAERDVGQVVAVIVNIDAIDCVGMKCVRTGVCIEDDHGLVLVSGGLECVQVAEVQSLIAQRGAETKSGEMVRHDLSFSTEISHFWVFGAGIISSKKDCARNHLVTSARSVSFASGRGAQVSLV